VVEFEIDDDILGELYILSLDPFFQIRTSYDSWSFDGMTSLVTSRDTLSISYSYYPLTLNTLLVYVGHPSLHLPI
jgi:hypothetical protein